MLLWIVYIDNLYKIYTALKASNTRYLKRIDWKYDNRRYINAKFMYRWYPIEAKREGMLTLKPRKFINKECLKGRL